MPFKSSPIKSHGDRRRLQDLLCKRSTLKLSFPIVLSLSAFSLSSSHYRVSRRRLLQNSPTSKAASIPLTFVKGTDNITADCLSRTDVEAVSKATDFHSHFKAQNTDPELK
ncbi:hypothetical protein ACTXT7_016442, partial [Hymenolepis weldensis]